MLAGTSCLLLALTSLPAFLAAAFGRIPLALFLLAAACQRGDYFLQKTESHVLKKLIVWKSSIVDETEKNAATFCAAAFCQSSD